MSRMSDHGLGGVFSPSEDQGTGEKQDSGSTNFESPLASDQLSAWFDNAPTFSTNSKEEAHEGYAITVDDCSSFDGPSSLPLGQMTPGEIPCWVGGQSSGTKRVDASHSLKFLWAHDCNRHIFSEPPPNKFNLPVLQFVS